MSGSYDRPTGRPQSAQRQQPDYDPYEDYVTGPATATQTGGFAGYEEPVYGDDPRYADPPTTQLPPLAPMPANQREAMYPPAREDKIDVENMTTPVVPPGSVTGRSLTLVITIMCFLACLTAGAVYMINQSADAWLKDIASEVTVQVEPQDGTDIEKTVKDVAGFLQQQPGIASVKPLSVQTSAELLEPWLGKLGESDALKALPVPRLIAIEVDRSSPPDLDGVGKALAKQFKGTSLDDHRRWQQQIRTVTRSFALGGFAILLLVAAATTAIIVSATKSAMASNREIVEVLHFVGATDKFIAREFEKHFLRLGIRAGLVGAAAALIVFGTMPLMLQILGGGSVTATEMQLMIGSGYLDTAGYVLLGIVVVVVAGLCMLMSRLGVYRILNAKH